MHHSTHIAIAALMVLGLAACGSPPTKTVRTTTTTTTVDDNGLATANARSELRTHVPITAPIETPLVGSSTSTTTTVNGPNGPAQTIEQTQSTDGNGTTVVQKRVTNY